MGHRNLTETVSDLERHGMLRRVDAPIDPDLEMAEVQRRLYAQAGPAVLFTRPKGTAFPMLANLFGTLDRTKFLFRDALAGVRKLVELKVAPDAAAKRPWRYLDVPLLAYRLLPRRQRTGPILQHTVPLNQLPQLKCWPRDGGAFVTLPQVYSEHPDAPGWRKSNLGMYRVQLSGNDFDPLHEVGLHYQIHRGIGVHHSVANKRGERLRVNVCVGGPPALTVSAVMPLPEGLPELAFAGALGGRRLGLVRAANGLAMPAECDFVISGTIEPTATKPEGPFGDHLGYYSLTHDFPVMKVDRVYHRPGAIWPFTVVGRPPQEDTSFGELIHDLTGPILPTVLPGVHAVHAVDAAGVHPLLLAIGSERYTPYNAVKRPQELLTIANAILGQGQLSLAKFLLIVAKEDNPALDIHHIPEFFAHLLERVDWANDLHFQTRTTMDTLDYSAGEGLNAGSKLVIAAVGPPRRQLSKLLPANLTLPDGFRDAKLVAPGVVAVSAPKHAGLAAGEYEPALERFARQCSLRDPGLPLVVLTDDADFTARRFDNFLWETFTRANPATDVLGLDASTHRKHYGCRGALVIDARLKPHMAPPLVEDPAVTRAVDALCARGGALHGVVT